MFQGRRKEAEQLNRDFPLPASSVDAVVLSHAHIDHSGRLPLLCRNGFRGPIYTTPATIDLCSAMLRDTAHIAESDAEFVNRKHPDEPAGRAALHGGRCRSRYEAISAPCPFTHADPDCGAASPSNLSTPGTSSAPRRSY